MLLMHFI